MIFDNILDSARRRSAFTGPGIVFGWTPQPPRPHRRAMRLGLAPRILDVGRAGHFFLHAAGVDQAESDERIVLVVGTVRAADGAMLTARDLLDRGLATALAIDVESIAGNALIVAISKRTPCFAVQSTRFAMPRVFFRQEDDDLLCATDMRSLVALSSRCELDEASLPAYFLFRSLPGSRTEASRTMVRGVRRLLPGEALRFTNGELRTHRPSWSASEHGDEPTTDRVDRLQRRLTTTLDAYLGDARQRGLKVAQLCSGGVGDQVLDQRWSGRKRRPTRYAIAPPSFATDRVDSESSVPVDPHTLQVEPWDYPRLLERTVEILGQPTVEGLQTPCALALGERLALREATRLRCFDAAGIGALLRVVTGPAATVGQQAVAGSLPRRVAGSWRAFAATWTRWRGASMRALAGRLGVRAAELRWARQCFGDRAVADALAAQHEELGDHRGSGAERVGWRYAEAAARTRLLAACGQDLVAISFDDEVVRAAMMSAPEAWWADGSGLSPGDAEGACWWLTRGCLRDRVDAIERPPFLSSALFAEMLCRPTQRLFDLLTLDIFRQTILGGSWSLPDDPSADARARALATSAVALAGG